MSRKLSVQQYFRNRATRRVLVAAAMSSLALPATRAFADPPLPVFGSAVYNVTVANASINGGAPASTASSDNATAINAYITYCSGHGGGTAAIPSGTFLPG